jgi:hypothetical protein
MFLYSTSAVCQVLVPPSCGSVFLGSQLSALNAEVQKALDAGEWGDEFSLRKNKAPIVILTPKGLVFFGIRIARPKEASEFNELLSETFGGQPAAIEHAICVGNSNDTRLPTAAILIHPELLSLSDWKASPPFYFLLPNSPVPIYGSWQLAKISSAHRSPLLVVNLISFSAGEILEVGRIIVHEGAHLFGQSKLLPKMPASALSNRSSRNYVEAKRQESQFARAALQEVQLAYSVLKRLLAETKEARSILEKNEGDETPSELNGRPKVGASVSEIELRQQFQSLVGYLCVRNKSEEDPTSLRTEQFKNEIFWYFMEGVPQYLEHRYMIGQERGHDRTERIRIILKQFEPFCRVKSFKDLSGEEVAFYPLLLGATYMQILERIYPTRDLAEKFGFNEQGLANWFDHGLGRRWAFAANDSSFHSTEYAGCNETK